MNRRVLVFGLASVVTLVGAVAACSSSTTTTDPGTTGDAAVASETSTSEGGGGQDSATSDSGTTTDLACGAMLKKIDCGNCCVQNHKTGYATFQTVLLACACMGTGADGGTPPCATDCADTLCKSPPVTASAACTTCLQNSIATAGACQAKVSTACTADADCLGEQQCVKQCTTKP